MQEKNNIPTGLYWKGKKTEVDRVALPFQTIETINESRATREKEKDAMFKTRQDAAWHNRLIWGDNKYVMSSLLEEFAGKIDLIYIDPPFATGADFSVKIEVGDVEWTKEPSSIEEKAYRDTWGKGLDSYLQMMYERLVFMRELLSEKGSIYVHLDWHVGHYVKILLDGVFGSDNFRNEIYVRRIRKNVQEKDKVPRLNEALDSVFFYAKSSDHLILPPRRYDPKPERWHSFEAAGHRNGMDYELFGFKPRKGHHWRWTKEKTEQAIKESILRPNQFTGKPEYKIEASEDVLRDTLWEDITASAFTTGYNTEKKEELLETIIRMASSEGALIADVFCGSGTTGAVAEKLNRRWLMCDIGRFAIHTTRKRLLDIEIPLLTPTYTREFTGLDDSVLSGLKKNPLGLTFMIGRDKSVTLIEPVTEKKVAQKQITMDTGLPETNDILSHLTERVEKEARIDGQFFLVYPIVRKYVRDIFFGEAVDLESEKIRRFLVDARNAGEIITTLAKAIGSKSITKTISKLKAETLRLMEIEGFYWKRGYVELERTVFNVTPCFNDFEKHFAQFLDHAKDINKFAKLAETYTKFSIEYLNHKGALTYYYTDFVAEQDAGNEEKVMWLIETKGWEQADVPLKDARAVEWCVDATKNTGVEWQYLKVKYDDYMKLTDKLNKMGAGKFCDMLEKLKSLDGSMQLEL